MIYFGLFLLSLFLTYSVRFIALKKSLLAIPNERSSHSVSTPHGGGIAIALTWFLGLLYFVLYDKVDGSLFNALVCGSLLSLVSYLDDLYELSPKIRLLIQALVSLLGLYLLGGLLKIDFGFFVIENQWITNVLAFLGLMWFINLYNFLDGIDGYAGSEAIFLAVAGWLLFGGDYFLVLISSVLGFLVWNWHKAKIFMGDVGSTLLGYSIGIFAIYHQNNGVSIFVWLILFGIFWFDATLTLYRRYQNKEKLSHAHRKHAYQRLVQSGWSHSKVVIYALGVNLVLAILGYSSLLNNASLVGSFIVMLGILYGVTKMIDRRKKFE
ncbi:glycosyltransferase family 4 protein [Sulfurospirillum sp. UCH001]|uniref:MraY family glycosyltransferase n=1 Tax=Sulfurospirillum sp. UCH001 TaxID=1581011 RepID=UPI00082E7146|nr:glycosyltransferase family 4 protein [Sulfurospirillum sp. UCH001]